MLSTVCPRLGGRALVFAPCECLGDRAREVRYCEGFRIPALHRPLLSAETGPTFVSDQCIYERRPREAVCLGPCLQGTILRPFLRRGNSADTTPHDVSRGRPGRSWRSDIGEKYHALHRGSNAGAAMTWSPSARPRIAEFCNSLQRYMRHQPPPSEQLVKFDRALADVVERAMKGGDYEAQQLLAEAAAFMKAEGWPPL